jgi:protease PrsW
MSTAAPSANDAVRWSSATWARPLRRWAWLGLLVAGLGLFWLVRQTVHTTGDANLVPALLLLGATVVPVSFVSFIYTRDLTPDVGVLTVLGVAVVGGVLGVMTATLLEYGTMRHLHGLPAVGVAVIEEASKLAVVAGVLLLRGPGRPATGLLLGAACGAGFAVMETLGYSAVELLDAHQNLAAVDAVLIDRGVSSLATHLAWTGLLATALWHAAARHWRWRAAARLVLTFGAVVALHAGWDSAHTRLAYLIVATLGLLALVLATPLLDRPISPRTCATATRSR